MNGIMNIPARPIIIFGGTTEGRLIGEWCSSHGIPALYHAASEAGALSFDNIKTNIGRMDCETMINFFLDTKPRLVIDATHPYAVLASANIKEACVRTNIKFLRVERERGDINNCFCFSNGASLIKRLNDMHGAIFAATGAKDAALFTGIDNFKQRVYLRLLPGIEGLAKCLELGYRAENLILMYGPFSKELNRAMFSATGASILVTKESGAAGGFTEKIEAARELGMRVAVIERPKESGGISVEALIRDILPVELL
jgi:precorrin-6x reductase